MGDVIGLAFYLLDSGCITGKVGKIIDQGVKFLGRIYRELAREYPLFTSDTHLNDVATDFVEHYHQRWRLMETPSKAGELPRYGGNAKAMLMGRLVEISEGSEREHIAEQIKQLEEQHHALMKV